MSHRITTQTCMTDVQLIKTAMDSAGWLFTENKSIITIGGGPLKGTNINSQNGKVSGDTDYHKNLEQDIGLLKKFYSEALVKQEAVKNGDYMESYEVLQDGSIRMIFSNSY